MPLFWIAKTADGAQKRTYYVLALSFVDSDPSGLSDSKIGCDAIRREISKDPRNSVNSGSAVGGKLGI